MIGIDGTNDETMAYVARCPMLIGGLIGVLSGSRTFAGASCSAWLDQGDGTSWATCVNDDGSQHCFRINNTPGSTAYGGELPGVEKKQISLDMLAMAHLYAADATVPAFVSLSSPTPSHSTPAKSHHAGSLSHVGPTPSPSRFVKLIGQSEFRGASAPICYFA